jgi:hypothetical protein
MARRTDSKSDALKFEPVVTAIEFGFDGKMVAFDSYHWHITSLVEKIASAQAKLDLEVATGLIAHVRFVLHHIPEFSTLFQIQTERMVRKVPRKIAHALRVFGHAMISDGRETQ